MGSLEELPLPPAEAASGTVAVDLDTLGFAEGSSSTHDADGGITLAGGESVSGAGWTLLPGRCLLYTSRCV